MRSSDVTADNSWTCQRSPAKRQGMSMVSSGVERAINTVPTGFSRVPPVGPAMPVTARPISAAVLERMPAAIAFATAELTAPCRASRSESTPSNLFFKLGLLQQGQFLEALKRGVTRKPGNSIWLRWCGPAWVQVSGHGGPWGQVCCLRGNGGGLCNSSDNFGTGGK